MDKLDQLIHALSRLPGVGKKSATRISYHLLRSDIGYVKTLGELIQDVPVSIRRCKECGNYCETARCAICSDLRRDRKSICVVEQLQDVAVLETSHEFNGYYHVLHGVLAPLDGVGPNDLNLQSLIRRIDEYAGEELITA